MYADRITDSMQRAIDETNRRRRIQLEYNEKMGITPQTIRKAVTDIAQDLAEAKVAEDKATYGAKASLRSSERGCGVHQRAGRRDVCSRPKELNFERAAQLRDEIQELRVEMGLSV
jgi:excinuclease ABC subunit B